MKLFQPNRYQALEENIRIRFKNRSLLDTAFVHKSYLNENREGGKEDNERLEFLGDAVLELVTTEYLFGSFPDASEGEMTSLRSALVKGKHLSEVATNLGLGTYLYLSKGEEKSGGRKKSYLLANALEALIGAIYLDRGFSKAHAFINEFILKNLGNILSRGLHVDFKSRFQELAQEKLGITPTYRVISEEGPDHRKVFRMAAYLHEEKVGEGNGSNKQTAEEEAARESLKQKGWLEGPSVR